MEKVDKHQEKLIKSISEEVTSLFEKVLDYAEVAVPNSDQYRKLRSKILRIGNNSIRNISKEVVNHYNITYNPPGETIIEITQRGKVIERENSSKTIQKNDIIELPVPIEEELIRGRKKAKEEVK